MFVCSFGTSSLARYQVVGTKGNLALDPAYEYEMELKRELTLGERTSSKGLADVRIVTALYRAAKTGRVVRIDPIRKTTRPAIRQQIHRPPAPRKRLVKARPPTR